MKKVKKKTNYPRRKQCDVCGYVHYFGQQFGKNGCINNIGKINQYRWNNIVQLIEIKELKEPILKMIKKIIDRTVGLKN